MTRGGCAGLGGEAVLNLTGRSDDTKTVKTRWDRDFAFDVGDTERHRVEVRWGQWRGDTEIFVDGRESVRTRHLFGIRRTRGYHLDVGDAEVHSVTVEKTRRLVLGGFRHQTFRAVVDGQVVGEF